RIWRRSWIRRSRRPKLPKVSSTRSPPGSRRRCRAERRWALDLALPGDGANPGKDVLAVSFWSGHEDAPAEVLSIDIGPACMGEVHLGQIVDIPPVVRQIDFGGAPCGIPNQACVRAKPRLVVEDAVADVVRRPQSVVIRDPSLGRQRHSRKISDTHELVETRGPNRSPEHSSG